MFWTTALFSKHERCVLVRRDVNSRLLWCALRLSVFRLVVSRTPWLKWSMLTNWDCNRPPHTHTETMTETWAHIVFLQAPFTKTGSSVEGSVLMSRLFGEKAIDN